MKKTMLTLAALMMGVGLAAMPAMAQDAPQGPPAGGHAHGGHHANPLKQATEGLTLTADQQKVLDDAQADAMTKMKALRDDTSTAPTDKRKQMMQIQKDAADKVRASLTDDQKTTFDANMAKAREESKARRAPDGGGGAHPAGAPPSDN